MSTQAAYFNSDRCRVCFCLFHDFALSHSYTHVCGIFSLFASLLPNLFPFLYPFPPSLPIPIPAPISTCPLITPSPLQGHSRRVQVTVKPVQHSGTLPLMVEAILSVSIGCVTARSTKLQRGLDSYQVRQTGLI